MAQTTTTEPVASSRPAPGSLRVAGLAGVGAAILGLVAEGILVRAGDDEQKYFDAVASENRYLIAYLLGGLAVLLSVVAFSGLVATLPGLPATLGRRLLPVGVALGLTEEWGVAPTVRILARDWRVVPETDVLPTFWMTEALVRLDGFLADTWNIVLLGVVPALIAVGMWQHRTAPRLLAGLAWIGAALTIVVAVLDLAGSSTDLSVLGIIGGVCVIAWLGIVSALLLRPAPILEPMPAA